MNIISEHANTIQNFPEMIRNFSAQDEHRLHKLITTAQKLNLVVIDELGFIPFTANGAHALFTFCSEIYERVALILKTNLHFTDWYQPFGDERLTAA